ncbi:MAG: peptide chain release factor 1 [Oscillospiraceae bacterium]|nr:peptide chain release factor 1 [Oscillospiraceae bacterium]
MIEKLEQIHNRYEEIDALLSDPAVYADPPRMAKLLREQKDIAPVVEGYRAYARCEDRLREANDLLSDESDGELRALAREEYDEAYRERGPLLDKLRVLLLPRDDDDDRSVIVEIRGGAGGEEAALFAASLTRMYAMYAEARRWKYEVLSVNETELGGIKEVSFLVEGTGAYARFKYESGVHRVQRVPDTEASGRIHTSTVTVAVLPEAEEVDVDINPADLQVDTFRSSGAGGQHINKTESAIRITHLPSGVVVECQDERSQFRNRDRAMKILRSKLLEAERAKQDAAIASDRKSQVGTGDRSERIRTYNFPQGRVTDHRIGLSLYKIDAIMAGALDELVDALAAASQAEKLRALSSE